MKNLYITYNSKNINNIKMKLNKYNKIVDNLMIDFFKANCVNNLKI